MKYLRKYYIWYKASDKGICIFMKTSPDGAWNEKEKEKHSGIKFYGVVLTTKKRMKSDEFKWKFLRYFNKQLKKVYKQIKIY